MCGRTLRRLSPLAVIIYSYNVPMEKRSCSASNASSGSGTGSQVLYCTRSYILNIPQPYPALDPFLLSAPSERDEQKMDSAGSEMATSRIGKESLWQTTTLRSIKDTVKGTDVQVE